MKNSSKQFVLLLLSVITIGTISCSKGDDPVVQNPIFPAGPVNLSAIPDNTAFTPTTSDKAARPTVSQTIDVLAGTDRSRLTVELTSTYTHTPSDVTDVYPVTLDPATKNLVTKTGLKVGVWTATYKIFETANPANSMTKIVTFTVFYDDDNISVDRSQSSFNLNWTQPTWEYSTLGYVRETKNAKLCGNDVSNNELMVFYIGSHVNFLDYYSPSTSSGGLISYHRVDSTPNLDFYFSDKYILAKKIRYNVDKPGVYRYIYDETSITNNRTTLPSPPSPTNPLTYGIYTTYNMASVEYLWVKL